MELVVYNIKGEETSRKVQLNDDVFAIEKPSDNAIYYDAKQYMADQRQGTHKSKERSEISGSTRKLKKQKGSGAARFGDIHNPLFRGGGRVFGPRPRDYSFKLNKKVKALARKSALTYKAADQRITIIEDFAFDAPKTKQFVELLNKFNYSGYRTLFVVPQCDRNVLLSARNLKDVEITRADSINTYGLMKAHHLFISENALPEIEKVCLK
ncbi:MAG: 50S ribosomal protein L4 [Bacteroidales bacterium]|jgi:large subunit ribosomal protein L4|nr:50S ribosomal protein L4 [Bacteroidales bacterium]